MAEDRIDSIINRPVVSKELTDTIAEVEATQQSVVDLAKEIINLNNAIGKTDGTKSFTKAQNDAALGLEKLQQAQLKTQLASQKLDDLKQKSADNDAKRAAQSLALIQRQQSASDAQTAKDIANSQKRQQQADKEAKAQSDALAKQNAALAKASTPYNALKLALDESTIAAQNIGAAFGKNSPEFAKASDGVASLRKQVDGINQPLGKFQDNVGNYGSAFSKIYGYIRTIANILPGVGIGTIFLAAGTGIELLINQLSKGQFSLDAFAASAEALKKALDSTEYKSAVSNIISLREQFKDAGDDVSKQQLALTAYNNTIGKTVGQTNDLNTAEKSLTDNAPAYLKSIFYKAAATEALASGTDDLIKATKSLLNAQANKALTDTDIKQLQNTIATSRNADEVAQAKYLLKIGQNAAKADAYALKNAQQYSDKIVNQTTSVYGKLTQLSDKFAEGFNGGADKAGVDNARVSNFIEVSKIQLQNTVDTNDKIAANDKASYKAREIALQKSADAQIQIRQLSLTQELQGATITKDKREVIEEKASSDILKIQSDLAQKQRDLDDKRSQQNLENLTKDIEAQKLAAKKIIDDTTASLDDREKAIADYYTESNILIDVREKEALKNAGQNQQSILAAQKDANNARLEVEAQFSSDQLKIAKEVQTALQKLFNDGVKQLNQQQQNEIANFKDAQDEKLLIIEKAKSDQLKSLADQYSKQKLTTDQYNASVLQATQKASIETVQVNLETAKRNVAIYQGLTDDQIAFAKEQGATEEDLAALRTGSAKDIQTANDNLTKAQIAADNLYTQIVLSNTQKIVDARKAVGDLEKQIASATIDLAKTVIDGAYQRQLDALSKQSDAIDANATTEKDAVERSLLTSSQKAAKEKVIDAQAASAKEAIAQRENKIKYEQAKTDRIISLAQIALTTAETIFKLESQAAIATAQAAVLLSNPLTAAYAPVAFAAAASIGAEVPFVLALAGIQAAAVLATPLPSYADGVKGHKGGLALYGEAGTELVIEPGKKPYLTDGATIGNLAAGTDVISNKQLVAAMANPGKSNYITNQLNLAGFIEASNQNTGRLEKAFKSQTNHHTTVTREGLRTSVRNGNAWTSYLKKNL